MMEKAILNFPKQFAFQPKIENAGKLKPAENFIVAGMGGSALGAELIKSALPELNLTIWRNYDLPPHLTPNIQRQTLVITSSYSGNTEETLSAFEKARKLKLNLAALSVGGKLLTLGKKFKVPYIQIPDTKIQPRAAIGFNIVSLLRLMGEKKELKNLTNLSRSLNPRRAATEGKILARKLFNKIPIIYSSYSRRALACNWKIKFNETGKIPAFCNVFPELNHNEMTSFDAVKAARPLSHRFHFLLLKDKSDYLKIQKRISITQKLYRDRGLPVEVVNLVGKNIWHKIFQNLLVGDFTALNLAKHYGADPELVPMVEELKELIK